MITAIIFQNQKYQNNIKQVSMHQFQDRDFEEGVLSNQFDLQSVNIPSKWYLVKDHHY